MGNEKCVVKCDASFLRDAGEKCFFFLVSFVALMVRCILFGPIAWRMSGECGEMNLCSLAGYHCVFIFLGHRVTFSRSGFYACTHTTNTGANKEECTKLSFIFTTSRVTCSIW